MRRTRLLNKLHKKPKPATKNIPKQTKTELDLPNTYALTLLNNESLLIIEQIKLVDALELYDAHKINDDELQKVVDEANDTIRQFEIKMRDDLKDIISKFENDPDKELISHLRDYLNTFNERVKKREEQD
jgi:hypothetical protein